jgi:hypothetical protein
MAKVVFTQREAVLVDVAETLLQAPKLDRYLAQ